MARDPRTLITPDAFTVAPELLGIALARPSRRLAAIAVDGILATILANSGWTLFLGVVLALFAWRAAAGPIERMVRGRSRVVLRVASVLFVVIVFANLWGFARDKAGSLFDAGGSDGVEVRLEGEAEDVVEDLELSATDALALAAKVAGLQTGDSAVALERSAELGRWVVEHTEPGEQRERTVEGLSSAVPAHALSAFQGAAGSDTGLVAAGTPADSAGGDSITKLLATNASLVRANGRLEESVRELRAERDRRPGVMAWFGGIFEDLGLGLGWFALYFTAFVVLGRGQTPGKRLLGIRIIRLDNRPIGWWLAFERFGGYAASASTGLLGFAQILWDRNRQALHDKATETVVIRLQKGQPLRLA